MDYPIGTVLLESHGAEGHSVWIRVAIGRLPGISPWLCVYSTTPGNIGQRIPEAWPHWRPVGTVPHTPAADIDGAIKEVSGVLHGPVAPGTGDGR